MDSKIQKWLQIAIAAPSGGNAQPWHIEYTIEASHIYFCLKIREDYKHNPSPMDVLGSASVMALGAFAFNLEAAALNDHYSLRELHWDLQKTLWNSAVFLCFSFDSNSRARFSNEDLLNRHTNRYPYESKSIRADVEEHLLKIVDQHKQIKCVIFKENKNKIKKLIAQLDSARWTQPNFFKNLLSEISYGREEAEIKDRIPLSQLGISMPDQLLMKVMRKFPDFFLKINRVFYKYIVSKSLQNYFDRSPMLILLQTQQMSFEHCYRMGQCFQEMWVYANKHQLGVQPLGAPLIALSYWHDKKQELLSQNKEIPKVTEEFRLNYDLDLTKPTMGFRLGYASKESARSYRVKLEVTQNQKICQHFAEAK